MLLWRRAQLEQTRVLVLVDWGQGEQDVGFSESWEGGDLEPEHGHQYWLSEDPRSCESVAKQYRVGSADFDFFDFLTF